MSKGSPRRRPHRGEGAQEVDRLWAPSGRGGTRGYRQRPQPNQRHWACSQGSRTLCVGPLGRTRSRRHFPVPWVSSKVFPSAPHCPLLGGLVWTDVPGWSWCPAGPGQAKWLPKWGGWPHGEGGRRQGSDLRCPPVTSLVPAHPSCTREGTLRQRHVCLVCGFFFPGKSLIQKQYFRFCPCSVSANRTRCVI